MLFCNLFIELLVLLLALWQFWLIDLIGLADVVVVIVSAWWVWLTPSKLCFTSCRCRWATFWCLSSWPTTSGSVLPSSLALVLVISSSPGVVLPSLTSTNIATDLLRSTTFYGFLLCCRFENNCQEFQYYHILDWACARALSMHHEQTCAYVPLGPDSLIKILQFSHQPKRHVSAEYIAF